MKIYVIYLLVLLSLFFIIRYWIGRDEFRNIESTDLSTENIQGISLMKKYDPTEVESILGKVDLVLGKNKKVYHYTSRQEFIVELMTNEANEIETIFTNMFDETIKTGRGINKYSSLSDIERAYGDRYLKKEFRDFMGSGNSFTITYVDKINEYKIGFDFHTDVKPEIITGMRLFKFQKKASWLFSS